MIWLIYSLFDYQHILHSKPFSRRRSILPTVVYNASGLHPSSAYYTHPGFPPCRNININIYCSYHLSDSCIMPLSQPTTHTITLLSIIQKYHNFCSHFYLLYDAPSLGLPLLSSPLILLCNDINIFVYFWRIFMKVCKHLPAIFTYMVLHCNVSYTLCANEGYSL